MSEVVAFPLFDSTGEYPSEEALEFIKNFDCIKYGCLELVKFIEQIWWAADWGYKLTGERIFELQLHTAGWSGNEDIISALKQNFIFWSMCWVKHVRGGHYYFEIKPIKP